MAAQFRITLFFEVGGDGWSESYHSSLQNPTTVVTQAITLVGLRIQMLPANIDLTHVRISDDLIFRDIYFDFLTLPVNGTYVGVPQLPPWNALLIKMQGTDARFIRNLFLRGIPTDQVSGQTFTPQKTWLTAYNAYLNYLTGGGFAIKAKDVTQVKQPIASVSATGVVAMQSAIPGLTGVPPNNLVEILGVKRSLSPTRVYQLASFTSTSAFSLRGWPNLLLANQGYFRLQLTVLATVIKVANGGITERRVGRPFGVPRGRRAIVR